jgi:hypothetical protein
MRLQHKAAQLAYLYQHISRYMHLDDYLLWCAGLVHFTTYLSSLLSYLVTLCDLPVTVITYIG